jgi:diaminohydroxyphosphoribosylaminopyrimidine deaminase/5-amino-6-(5-phosphoribosylamino)uracil reductase
LVGVQTIINDDPYLTTREWPGNNPLRIILDPNNRVTEKAKVLCDDFPTLIVNKFLSNRKLKKNKEELLLQPFNLQKLMKECHQKDISSILVEGGQKNTTILY